MTARLLDTISVEKPWGRDRLPSPFTSAESKRIGEIWFDPPPEWPDVLVKYLFTSENLSVQVHPDDKSAPAGSRGKEECWLVLDAEPEARLAAGFKRETGATELRDAALSGTIERMLEWHEVERGDVFFLPARTVHAIGAGLAILEVQQNSDITYRLYDYGRPRELHLDEAVAVAETTPYPSEHRRHFDLDRATDIMTGRYFEIEIAVHGETQDHRGDCLYLPLIGRVTAAGVEAEAGSCLFVSRGQRADFEADAVAVVVKRPWSACSVPDSPHQLL